MKSVEVTLPVVGYAYLTVEVPNDATDDDIYKEACEQVELQDIHEWNTPRKVVEGQVLHVPKDEWSIDSVTQLDD